VVASEVHYYLLAALAKQKFIFFLYSLLL